MVCPGSLWIFVFTRELFVTADVFKMFLLAAAASVPVFLLNILLGMVIASGTAVVFTEGLENLIKPTITAEEKPTLIISSGALLSLPPLYVPLLIRAFVDAFSVKIAILTGIGIEVVVFSAALYSTKFLLFLMLKSLSSL
jgi:hypothetical protein